MNKPALWKLTKQISFYALVLVIMIVSIFPFYYAILTSLKTGTAIFEVDYLPTHVNFGNFISLFKTGHFIQNIFNSVIVSTIVVILSLLLAVLASFALARIQFGGRKLLLLTILSVSMFPQVAVLSGLFEVVRFMGLYNTLTSLVIAYMIFTLPFTVWILTTFMRELPIELEEAAIVDGASPLVIVFKVFLPLLWPAMVTTGLLAFIAAWNEFLFALTFVSNNETRTVPVAIAMISGASDKEIPWGPIMAASVIVTLPLIMLVLIFQKRIVAGLTAGSVKG
ncbi:MAG: carbohydrate ABC transporter permease [Alphaproteobacteria bacterium]